MNFDIPSSRPGIEYHGGTTSLPPKDGSFNENIDGNKRDPLAPEAMHQFPYDEVAAALGEDVDMTRDEVREQVATALAGMLRFCLNTDLTNKKAEQIIGRRLVALAWVVNPGLFDGSPSLIKLSKRMGMQSIYKLAVLTGEASRHFKIQNRAQAHAWNRGQSNHATAPAIAPTGVIHLSDAKRDANAPTAQPATIARRSNSANSAPHNRKGKESFTGSYTELVPKQAGIHA
jgi:hypothetical protein